MGLIWPSFSTTCSSTPLSKEGRRQRGSSDKATSKVCQDQTQRWTYLPLNLWGTRPPTRRSETSATAYICWDGHQVHHLVGSNGERRQSETSYPVWGAICIGEATPSPPRKSLPGAAVAIPPPIHLWESWSRSRRDQHGEAYGRPERPISRCWRLPTCWSVTLRH